MKGRSNGSGDLLRIGDDEVVLGNRHRHAPDIRFLKGVGAKEPSAHLPRNGHHRHGVKVGVGKRRHQVSRPRARRCNHDAHLP